ncbi:ITGA7 isoform 6 [Pongo abelii]|uniref:ITGA7 isoform 6 n=3 Tax=Pongo abelii TaxID=9601 RepID=A0A2J8UI70_PONAB|nr:ITGA7 isoform 6 [Pongo abelii]
MAPFATPIVQALTTTRIQRQAEGFQCWRGCWWVLPRPWLFLGSRRIALEASSLAP